jgi:exopolysaccharide biosynthesis WecB/TagA/CpsF family protein
VVDGYVDPYTVAERVRAARPDVLLVALGNPLQECWIDANLAQLDARVAIGVGALFDYLAGRVVRAPRWVRALRGEWLFRLLVEPRRLWRRYVLGNPQFLWRVLRARERV